MKGLDNIACKLQYFLLSWVIYLKTKLIFMKEIVINEIFMKTILCNHSSTLEGNERIEIGHFRIETNQKNLEKSGNWKSIKRNKGIVWEFIKKMVKSGKCHGIWKHAVVKCIHADLLWLN